MKKYTSFILPGFLIALFLGCASELCAGGKPPVPKNPSRIFRLRQPSLYRPELNVTRPVHSAPFGAGTRVSAPALPNANAVAPAAVPATTALSGAVQRQAAQAQGSVGLVAAFHTWGEESANLTPERPPIWEMMGGYSSNTTAKMSALRLRIALAEEHALPPNVEEWDRESLQEFYDTYMALKSGAGVRARFDGKESERKAWARQQKDFLEENYVDDKYTKPFHPQVNKLRILVVNDKREPLEPLLEAAAKDSRVDVTWAMSPKGIIQKLKSGFYDVVLCDYVMRGGTADMLGMNVYNEQIPVPVVLYSMAGATPDYLLSHNILGRMEIALTSQDAKRVFNYLSNLTIWHKQVLTPAPQGVSVIGYFHGAADGKWNELEAAVPPLSVGQQDRRLTTAKRSRESLETELNEWGFASHELEKMSRDDMEELLNSYRAFVSAQTVTPRYNPNEGTLVEQIKQLEAWAKTQPDYVEDNYVAYDAMDDEYGHFKYAVPFHPAAETMRVLAVRDDAVGVEEINELAQAAKQSHPGVTVELVTGVSQAKFLLDHNHYDVVLTDYVLGDDYNGFQISMHVWNKKLNIPVVSYSNAPMAPLTLFQYNIVGEIDPAIFPDEAERVLNYLSNIAVTGKAYPNK